MSFQAVTYKSILESVAYMAGLTYATVVSGDLARWTSFANSKMDWMWRPPNRMFAWDFSIDTATITITDGKFDNALIDYADWWSLWTEDPRPYTTNGGSWPNIWPLRVRAFQDADGIWPQTSESTVFAFYRLARPKFTTTAVDTGTTYALNSLVYDPSDTGDCYLATTASAPGNNLADSKWTKQRIPEVLAEPLASFIDGERLRSLGSLEKSRNLNAEAETWLDLEMMRQLPRDGSGPPWAYNGSPNYFDRYPS